MSSPEDQQILEAFFDLVRKLHPKMDFHWHQKVETLKKELVTLQASFDKRTDQLNKVLSDAAHTGRQVEDLTVRLRDAREQRDSACDTKNKALQAEIEGLKNLILKLRFQLEGMTPSRTTATEYQTTARDYELLREQLVTTRESLDTRTKQRDYWNEKYGKLVAAVRALGSRI